MQTPDSLLRYHAAPIDEAPPGVNGPAGLATIHVLIVADDKDQMAALQRTFARYGHTVHVAIRIRKMRRLLREHAPGIVIIAASRRALATERTVGEIKQEGSARVILMITTDTHGRSSIEVLRKNPDGYVRTSSITLAGSAWDQTLWTWIAALSSTLCLTPEAHRPLRRPR